ncbi:hypothetical protein [Pantoea sp. AS-PWVM4]|uniref:hypothetical protein n=1 Tax=Pantoea sp. AS-PWVM4 TaxID=1332069 RepID=UPI00056C5117|nr:hypothetical protein [Pantoea sp. AS-PWVM4]
MNRYSVEFSAVDGAGGHINPVWRGQSGNKKQAIQTAIAGANEMGWQSITLKHVFLVQSLITDEATE